MAEYKIKEETVKIERLRLTRVNDLQVIEALPMCMCVYVWTRHVQQKATAEEKPLTLENSRDND